MRQSTGEYCFRPCMIARAKGGIASIPCVSRSRFISVLSTQVLMKIAFRNSMFGLSERATALKNFPLPQQASSSSGPSTATA